MFTRNPILTKKSFYAPPKERKETFSISGAVNKSIILLTYIILIAFVTWYFGLKSLPYGNIIIGVSGTLAFVIAIVIRYKREWAKFLVFIYGLFKGIFLGAISANYELRFEGIIAQAVFLTLVTFIVMGILYKFSIIKVTKRLRSMVYTSTGAIMLIYFISFLLYLFGLPRIPYIHENGWIGIVFSLFVCFTASFHLLLDFDFFEKARNYKFPYSMEWYAAFGLVISIVWQYLSLLRLLRKVRGSNFK